MDRVATVVTSAAGSGYLAGGVLFSINGLEAARVALAGLCATALGVASGYGGHAATEAPLSAARFDSLPDLVAKVRSGVVRIETHTCSGDIIGTGIVLGARRIATVEHMVDGAATIQIKRNGKLLATASVIGSDKSRDLALLATSQSVTGYRFQFADRAPRLAERVEVLGYPLGGSLSG